MNELGRIEKWLYSYLSSDTTLNTAVGGRFYGPKAKTGTGFPYITWNWQGATDVNGNGAVRLMTRPLYQIKVVSQGLTDTVAGIADELDARLQTASEITYNGVTISVRREQPLSYIEAGQDPETNFHHLGGLYRVYCQKAP
jgi:hypothetical protein